MFILPHSFGSPCLFWLAPWLWASGEALIRVGAHGGATLFTLPGRKPKGRGGGWVSQPPSRTHHQGHKDLSLGPSS